MAKRKFLMHNKLLIDVIKKQTGSLHKAVTEAVMNSIEAKASYVNVTLGQDRIRIEDDGIGFTNKKQLKYCFDTFGSPHTEGESKVWASFRMGRGQLFSFGANTWRTGRFQMEVDIEKCLSQDNKYGGGIGYELKEGLTDHKGCSIEIRLYDQLDGYSISHITREITDYIKYVATPVTVNGNPVTTPPDKNKWDMESEDCLLKFLQGGRGLAIYNLGIYVNTNYNLGVAGIVVSKKKLDLNFPRNEVISSCPVWKKIRQFIAKNVNTAMLNKSRLADDERAHVINSLLDGLYSGRETIKSPLFPDVTGRYWSAGQIERNYYNRHWTFAPEGSRAGDRIMQLNLGIAFDEKTMNMFSYKGEPRDFFDRLRDKNNISTGLHEMNFRQPTQLLDGIDTNFIILPAKKVTKREKILLKAASSALHIITPGRSDYRTATRHLHVGIADMADGWTNGSSYICITRNYLRKVNGDKQFTFTNLAFLLLHEMLHDTADTDSHIHTPEFYHNYHDMTEQATRAGNIMFNKYRKLMKKDADAENPLAHEQKLIDEEKEITRIPAAAKSTKKGCKKSEYIDDSPTLF